jgi:hypothetical protein
MANESAPVFIAATVPWADRLFAPLRTAYSGVQSVLSRSGRLGSWLLRDHLLLFSIACGGILLLTPRYLVLARYVIERFLLGQSVVKPDTSLIPYTPNLLIGFLALFLLTIRLERRHRMLVLLLAALPMAFVLDARLDLISLVTYLAFLSVVYLWIKCPLRRAVVVTVLCVASLGFMVLCNRWEPLASSSMAGLTAFQAAFLPLLWYSAYEQLPPKRRLAYPRFIGYQFIRFFGSPVTTYKDIFSQPEHSLARVRFDGIKALYVAAIAAIVNWAIGWLETRVDPSGLGGIRLLVFSYLSYVGAYCKTVIGFNIFIGGLRLLGVPIRDNFHYWLLARTPNEHWRRWNLLLREWVITFVFFPIMRAKRWLFVSVMAALLASGALHIVPKYILGRYEPFRVGTGVTYWILNGLAIYLVLKVPLLFPKAVARVGIGTHRAWDVIGIVLTSAFYAIIVYIRSDCQSLSEVADYLGRLFLRLI